MDDKVKRESLKSVQKPGAPEHLRKAQKPGKTAKAQEPEAPTIIRKKSAKKEEPTPVIDSSRPTLEPFKSMPPTQLKHLSDSVGKKLGSPLPLDQAEEVAEERVREFTRKAETAAEKIDNIKKEDISAEYRYLLIMHTLRETMGIQIDINILYSQEISKRQDEEKEAKIKSIEDQKKAQEAAKKAGWASRILSWIGALGNIIAAAGVTALAVIGVPASAGAGTPAVWAASLWLTSAVVSAVELVLQETGAMDKLAEAMTPKGGDVEKTKMGLGIFMMVVKLALAVGSGAAAFKNVAQSGPDIIAFFKKITEITASITQSFTTLGEGGAKIAMAYAHYDVAMAEIAKTKHEDAISALRFYMQEVVDFMKNMSKINSDLGTAVSEYLRTGIARDKAITGNI